MKRRFSDEERLARTAAGKKAWRAANPNYRAEHLEQHRTSNRESERRRYAAVKRRRAAVERAGEWAKKNPEKRQEARDRYKVKEPEKYRAQQREYYHRNKEAIKERRQAREAKDPEKLREDRRRYAGKTPSNGSVDRLPLSDERREKYYAQLRDTKRIERRLKAAGLPPRRVHRTLVSERRASLWAGEEFFSRRRSRDEIRRVAAGDFAEGKVDPKLVQDWARGVGLMRRRAELLVAARAYIAKHGDQLRREITLDSRARRLLGKEPLDMDVEIRWRAMTAVRGVTVPLSYKQTTMKSDRPAPVVDEVITGESTGGTRAQMPRGVDAVRLAQGESAVPATEAVKQHPGPTRASRRTDPSPVRDRSWGRGD